MPEIVYNDRDAEMMILGAIIQDPDSILKISDLIQCEDLYSEKHRLIYGACLDLYQLGEAIDLISVRDRLRVQGNEDLAGGLNYLSDCLDSTPTSANVKCHARIVAKLSLKRQIKAWLLMKQQSIAMDIEPDEFFAGIEMELVKLAEKVKEKKDPYATGIVQSIVKYWDTLEEKKGFIETDPKMGDAIPGFFPGHLIMIGGYTSTERVLISRSCLLILRKPTVGP